MFRGRRATAILVFLSTVFGVLFAESAARLSGFEPFTFTAPNPFQPRLFLYDPELGWKNKPGIYKVNYMADHSYPVILSIRPDGSRSSPGRETLPISKRIYFFGGSVGFGWAVSDGDIFSNIVARETEFAGVNLSVAGYGALQNLLVLERVARDWTRDHKPAAIIYAFLTHHTHRSVGDPPSMRQNEKNGGAWNVIRGIPYTRLNDQGELEVCPPSYYFRWPLREYSALVTLAKEAFVDLTWKISRQEMEKIVSNLFIRFRDIARSKGVPVYVVSVIMQPHDFLRYKREVVPSDLPFVDCSHPEWPSPRLRVPNDGHPTPEVHAFYARCILEKVIPDLRKKLSQ